MESYVEVTFINGCILLYVSMLLAQYASWQPISKKRCLIYVITISFFSSHLWNAYSIYILILIELLFFIGYFRFVYKAYIFALCFRFLCMGTCFIIYGGGFHNGLWFVPLHASIGWSWLGYSIILLFLHIKWKDWMAKRSCIYETTIYTIDKKMKVKGYLDSGNLLTYEGIPVVFLDKQYQAYFNKERIELIVMNTVAETQIIRCYACELQIMGCAKHNVFIHCEKELSLPYQCKLLLNMKVITMG